MHTALTPNQQRIVETINNFISQHDRVPTHTELTQLLGYRSKNSVQQYIDTLRKKGYLEGEPKKWRNAKLSPFVQVPVVGRVACGTPVLADQNIEEYLPIDKGLLGSNPDDFYFLKASGDSMNMAGINDGDLLLVERGVEARSGDVVVALLDDEATVKLYKPGDGFVVLLPRSSNPTHKPIIVAEGFSILGLVRKVIKQSDLSA